MFDAHQINYGRRVYRLRKRYRFSQLELEALTHQAPGSVSRIENGHINPTKETLFRIARVLSLSVPEVVELFAIKENLKLKNSQV